MTIQSTDEFSVRIKFLLLYGRSELADLFYFRVKGMPMEKNCSTCYITDVRNCEISSALCQTHSNRLELVLLSTFISILNAFLTQTLSEKQVNSWKRKCYNVRFIVKMVGFFYKRNDFFFI